MNNFKRKSALMLAMMLVFVTVFGVLKPSEAKAWTNLTIAQFDTIYEHNGSKEVTYKLTLPSSGKLTQITSVTGEYVNFYMMLLKKRYKPYTEMLLIPTPTI